jgi:hypothetical protein
MAITKRQRQVYDFISEFVQKNGYSPSFEEIGEGRYRLVGCGMSTDYQCNFSMQPPRCWR